MKKIFPNSHWKTFRRQGSTSTGELSRCLVKRYLFLPPLNLSLLGLLGLLSLLGCVVPYRVGYEACQDGVQYYSISPLLRGDKGVCIIRRMVYCLWRMGNKNTSLSPSLIGGRVSSLSLLGLLSLLKVFPYAYTRSRIHASTHLSLLDLMG